MGMALEYTCSVCGEECCSDVSESDAIIEYQNMFSDEMRAFDGDPPAIVCDDCYRKMLPPEDVFRDLKSKTP
jgi:hypothetical protein